MILFNAGHSPKAACIPGSHFLDHTIHLEDTPRGHNYLLHMLAKKRKWLFLDSGPLNQGTWCWTTVPSTIMLPSSFERCLFMSGPSGGHFLRWCFVWALAQRAWGLACCLWRGHWMTAFILSGRKTDSWIKFWGHNRLCCERLLHCVNPTYISFTENSSAKGCSLIFQRCQPALSFLWLFSVSLSLLCTRSGQLF